MNDTGRLNNAYNLKFTSFMREHHHIAKPNDKGWCRRMQQHVDKMIWKWGELMQHMVDVKRERGQWTVWLVTVDVMHAPAPEVVREQSRSVSE